MPTFLRALSLVAALLIATAAQALTASDGGTFVALDEEGNPVEKILRITRHPAGWKFEDRQPDGSWLDVSCHGGCDHRPASSEDLLRLFGSEPPPGLKPECIFNTEYAFCHLVKQTERGQQDGYVLVVRWGEAWQPISLARLPNEGEGPPKPAPNLEAASL